MTSTSMRLALVGAPNSGKTTLFNGLTGGLAKTANYAGTTVETSIRVVKKFERSGWVRLGRGHLLVIDRPALRIRAGGEDPERS